MTDARNLQYPGTASYNASDLPSAATEVRKRSISGLRELRSLDLRFARSLANSRELDRYVGMSRASIFGDMVAKIDLEDGGSWKHRAIFANVAVTKAAAAANWD
ncbi:hypothetical protein TIFTF001_002984 [Ficus carica]|uniref:Uncharacterized protein n=1 Tax=Ficus carica TaxID=3494 RepID=A0AA87Z776_FICCA|nr:hypothetical protein TIFTF001_002984 [Ficus carica]